MKETPENPENPEIHSYVQYKSEAESYSVAQSFKYAVDGILDVFRTQKHMRFHFIAAVVVLLIAILMDMSKLDIFILLFMISIVLITEMLNTAIEAVVDLVTQEYHPIAKFAKDAAAGAVLIATTAAGLIAILLILEQVDSSTLTRMPHESAGMGFRVVITGIILFSLVTIIKLLTKGGTLLKGGAVSGHSAFGFFFASTIYYVTGNPYIGVLSLITALLVAQSRMQSRIHSFQEVTIGGALAVILSVVVYWIAGK
ncbi:MAG: diacylglycerol kinase [Armatimonadota bacterium]